MLVVTALPLTAGAQDAPSPSRMQVGAFVDGDFAYNNNRPADHANFFPGVGTSAKRDNEVDHQPGAGGPHAGAGAGRLQARRWASAPRRGRARGRGARHRHRPRRLAPRRAGLGAVADRGRRGLLLEAGIYPSHIGMESLPDPSQLELHPLVAGRAVAVLPDRPQARVPVHRALVRPAPPAQRLADDRRQQPRQELGAQLAYTADAFSVSFNGIVGPELADNDDDMRILGDVVVTWKATKSLSLGLSVDAAREGRTDGNDVGWYGRGPLRAVRAARLAHGLRAARRVLRRRGRRHLGDRADPQGADGDPRAPAGGPLDPEARGPLRHVERAGLRGRPWTRTARPLRKKDQFLLLLGVVATF